MRKERRALKVEVVEMLLNERWPFDEIFPMFTDTFESDKGFYRKAFENVEHDFMRKK